MADEPDALRCRRKKTMAESTTSTTEASPRVGTKLPERKSTSSSACADIAAAATVSVEPVCDVCYINGSGYSTYNLCKRAC